MSGDMPSKSAAIKSDPVFSKSDQWLNQAMVILMESLSIGDMEKVALEMRKRFAEGTGGTYTSDVLNNEIKNNPAFVNYHYAFTRELMPALKRAGYDPVRINPLRMGLLDFSSFWDKVSGLGITVHQVWSAKAEIENYRSNTGHGSWQFDLVYTFYDHFGLDWEDVVKNGDRHFPQYHTGDFFKAWYILQHYRGAKPFITKMTRIVPMAGRLD